MRGVHAALMRRRRAGFTLIELLVVVIIIGILLAIGIPAYLTYQSKAKDTDAKAALQTAYKAAVAGDAPVNTGKFGVATSIVSDIHADEPAASVARGDCLAGVANAPVKQVLVDPASTTTNVQLCVRSASGSIWKLSGPLSGTPTVSDGSTVAFTYTGGEITDAIRAAGSEGDGLTNDSSTGVWESTTNLWPRGQNDAGSSYGIQGSGVGLSIDSTTAKFGTGSEKVVTPGTIANEGCDFAYSYYPAVAASQTYTASAWFKAASGQPMRMILRAQDATKNTTLQQFTASFTGTGSWQRVQVSGAFNASAAYADVVFVTGNQTATTFWFDGVQVEQKPIATPFTVSSRANAALQMPASLLTPTQGWAALHVRLGWAAASPPRGGAAWDWWFKWGTGSGATRNSIDGLYREAGSLFDVENYVAGASVTADGPAQSFAANTTHTLIIFWTATTVGSSIDGGSFVTSPRSNGVQTASSMPATFSLGASGTTTPIDGAVFWAATGTGTLTNADAATINGFGDPDPTRGSFPAAAQTSMVWDGVSASGSLK